jgi:two-component system, NarL family, response regulator LiaR
MTPLSLFYLVGLDPELEVVGEAADGAEALSLARTLKPDVVLMDLLMPVMNGLSPITAIRRELPETEVIALTSVLEDVSVVEAIRAGAIGYLLKDTEASELRRALKAAAAGQVQLSPKATARLLREIRAPESPEIPKLLIFTTKADSPRAGPTGRGHILPRE